ncbi:alpha/beta hydrolase [Nocardia sputorum]|uniref:alpha/beta fold hydrolase n=1 Tax=Nocardia sputorum TaxID=2984338 RepID=UPI0024909606|nr:alpha/beta hydrolase [Nocardia sputorum]BDT91911.1 alpha/beta hydrolase [Nocardia sputorum]
MKDTRRRGVRIHRVARVVTALTAVVAGGALTVACTASTTTHAGPTPDAPRPTIVLEHGAFADGSSWNEVIERLTHHGYHVVAAANPLLGPAADAAALEAVLGTIDGPVVLVGHSYGGSVISAAAAGNPQVAALVYVAAFLPAPGETALDLTGRFPGSTLPAALGRIPITGAGGTPGEDLYIRQDAFHDQFAADVDTDRAALMAATQRPIAQSALEEPATAAAWTDKPTWDVITTEDRNIPVAAQRFMAERAHAHVTEVAASHSVAVSHPGVVADVIEQAAQGARR